MVQRPENGSSESGVEQPLPCQLCLSPVGPSAALDVLVSFTMFELRVLVGRKICFCEAAVWNATAKKYCLFTRNKMQSHLTIIRRPFGRFSLIRIFGNLTNFCITIRIELTSLCNILLLNSLGSLLRLFLCLFKKIQ